MKINAKRVSVAAVVLATGATLLGGAGASAATVGGLSLNPASDTTTTNYPIVSTSGACSNPAATNFIVVMRGPGLPAAGVNVVGNTSLSTANPAGAGKSYTFSQRFYDVFQGAGITAPSGAYTVSWQCTDGGGINDYGDFVSDVTFTHASSQAVFDAGYTSAPAATPSTTTLTAPASAAFGAPVTLSAAVAPTAATGTVQFMDGATALGTAQTVTNGTASYTTSALTAGSHSITAVFSSGSPSTYSNSTSAASTVTISQASTSVSLTGPSSVQQYQQASFVAAITPSTVGGSVAFTVDGSAAGTVTVSGGSATYSTSSLGVGNHTVTAVFTPSNPNYSASPVASTSTTVAGFTGVQAAQPITVNVPSGSLSIAIGNYTDDSVASVTSGSVPVVNLGTASMRADGQFFEATGQLNNVTITDTRAGNPGWTAQGVVTDFTQASVPAGQTAETISGANLGWSPSIVSLSANQSATGGAHPVVVGGVVAPGNLATGAAIGTAGLATPKTFAVAQPGQGNGAAVVAGGLDLTIPTDRAAGVYNATLTFTVM